ncbi:toxic anion resistance protein [Falsirhodobacter halotolerans]|uniref:toxic anion resistance protein n=1 Tax=Falsirhodobacter halotolerans TaxID=1146892 RepID=UPI001FD30272|nr:toxic anion resistance protein [Falsirhodobacter halotolerans]MCJ8140279.1 toxic anion resistance protein [Falsirhodobacter halotolerans]
MKTTVAQTAAQTSDDIAALPANAVPDDDLPASLDTATPEDAMAIRARMDELDVDDAQSILRFGAKAQGDLRAISAEMLEDVRTKSLGPAGDSLRDMITVIRGFSVSELDVRRKPTWFEKVTGRGAPFTKFVARYERIQAQLDHATEVLLDHEHKLLKDIRSLDILYDRTLDFYRELGLYIAAGEAVLNDLDRDRIPREEGALSDRPDHERMPATQALRDLRAARDDLDRRVHDLKLTRQVTMQSLPAIRLVQENDKGLIGKINSTLVNTVPLWETQLAQAVTIQRGREAAGAIRAANDLTNDLLKRNAESLQSANREIRTEIERGVFDVDAIRQANTVLVTTLNESLQLTEDAKARRASAEDSLSKMESDLRDTLAQMGTIDMSARG